MIARRGRLTLLVGGLFFLLPAISGCNKSDSKLIQAEPVSRTAEGEAGKPAANPATPDVQLANPIAGQCPVSNDPIDASIKLVLDGKTYAFCCESCRDDFEKDPGKFISKKAPQSSESSRESAASESTASGTEVVYLGKGKGLKIDFPKTWKKTDPENNMRLFQAEVPGQSEGQQASEFAVFNFALGGGGKEANIKRWSEQFGGQDSFKGEKEFKSASGKKATIYDFEGRYTPPSFSPNTDPKDDYRMLVAVAEGDEAGVFMFKLIGSKDTVDSSYDDFRRLIESIR